MSIAEKIKKIKNKNTLPGNQTIYKYRIADSIKILFKALSVKANVKHRDEQVDLSCRIYETLKGNGVSIFESPTGTGKTLAYLVGACQYAKEERVQVVIATTTRYLQLQALDDFARHLKPHYPDISIAILKGKTNYLSPKRLGYEQSLHTDNADILSCLNAIAVASDGVGGDITLLPQELMEEAERHDIDINAYCIKEFDNDIEHTFYYERAKENASNANIVITNHHNFAAFTFFCKSMDTAQFKGGKVIVDEAHELENNVFNLAKTSIAFSTVRNTIKRLLIAMESDRNNGNKDIKSSMIKTIKEQFNVIHQTINEIKDHGKNDKRSEIFISKTGTGNSSLHNAAYKSVITVHEAVGHVISVLRKVKNNIAFLHIVNDLLTHMEAIRVIYTTLNSDVYEKACYLLRFSDKEKYPSVHRIEYNLIARFTKMWSHFNSIILLSGTLVDVDGKNFNSIKKDIYINKVIERVGLLHEKRYGGFSFKDKVNVFLYPKAPLYAYGDDEEDEGKAAAIKQYIEDIKDYVHHILEKAVKGVLILTASHMETELLEKVLKSDKVTAYVPWGKMTLLESIKQFEKDKNTFISASAWTGMDIKDTISDIIITRIPNVSPGDPIVRAAIFNKKSASIVFLKCRHRTFVRMRQGIGRLCRKEADRGNVHILDARILGDKKYENYLNYVYNKFTCGAQGSRPE